MWTLFVFNGPLRKARHYDCLMIEGVHVIETERRFKEEVGWSHLVFPYRTFSAATKQEAWNKAVEAKLIPKYRIEHVWNPGQHRMEPQEKEYPTVGHPDHYLNNSRSAKVLPKVKEEPKDALFCITCSRPFQFVSPNQPDGFSFKCRTCRGEF